MAMALLRRLDDDPEKILYCFQALDNSARFLATLILFRYLNHLPWTDAVENAPELVLWLVFPPIRCFVPPAKKEILLILCKGRFFFLLVNVKYNNGRKMINNYCR